MHLDHAAHSLQPSKLPADEGSSVLVWSCAVPLGGSDPATSRSVIRSDAL